jgi:hypothetical protein
VFLTPGEDPRVHSSSELLRVDHTVDEEIVPGMKCNCKEPQAMQPEENFEESSHKARKGMVRIAEYDMKICPHQISNE